MTKQVETPPQLHSDRKMPRISYCTVLAHYRKEGNSCKRLPDAISGGNMLKWPYFDVIGSIPFLFWHITAMSETRGNTSQTLFLVEICKKDRILKLPDLYRLDSGTLRQVLKLLETPLRPHFSSEYDKRSTFWSHHIGTIPFWFWHVTAMSDTVEKTSQSPFLVEICRKGHILKPSDWHRFDSGTLRQCQKQLKTSPRRHFWPKYA